ncbi:response regulator transcription factor [Paeniglutamicibacter sulfureus]|uniref:response regulator transcription factor n=1 Tax=Paeniglutamicibacter sulfureus TaxID=43666 RepID=UPI00345C77FE
MLHQPEGGQGSERACGGQVEDETACLVARARTTAEIAETLFLSPGTVKNHVAGIQRKPGVGLGSGLHLPSRPLVFTRASRPGPVPAPWRTMGRHSSCVPTPGAWHSTPMPCLMVHSRRTVLTRLGRGAK